MEANHVVPVVQGKFLLAEMHGHPMLVIRLRADYVVHPASEGKYKKGWQRGRVIDASTIGNRGVIGDVHLERFGDNAGVLLHNDVRGSELK